MGGIKEVLELYHGIPIFKMLQAVTRQISKDLTKLEVEYTKNSTGKAYSIDKMKNVRHIKLNR